MKQKRAVVMIVCNGKREMLLVKKEQGGISELAGKWALPAETLEGHESDQDAIRRGLDEEVRLVLDGEATYITETNSFGMQIGWYSCMVKNPDCAIAGSDADDFKWGKRCVVLALYGQLRLHPLPDKVKEFLKTV